MNEQERHVRALSDAPKHGLHDYVAPPMLPDVHGRALTIYRDGPHQVVAVCDYPGCGWTGRPRAQANAAEADALAHGSDLHVVLTDIDQTRKSVIALPLVWAATQLRAYATLLGAQTFAEARQDPYAAALVDGWVQSWAEDEREVAGQRVTGQDSGMFDAEALWGIDNWRVWKPDPTELTQVFLDIDAMDACLFLDDGEDHLLDEEPPLVVPAGVRDKFETVIRQYGWVVRRRNGLAALFDSPPEEPWAALGACS